MLDGTMMQEVAVVAASIPTNHREVSDHYSKVVTLLPDKWRVIECRDGIQWIVQRRQKRVDDRAWTGRAYCTTRKALMRVIHGLELSLDPSSHATLASLPERTGR